MSPEDVKFQQGTVKQDSHALPPKTAFTDTEQLGQKDLELEFEVTGDYNVVQSLWCQRCMHRQTVLQNSQLQIKYDKLKVKEDQVSVGELVYTIDRLAFWQYCFPLQTWH